MNKIITLDIAGLHIALTCKNTRLFNALCQRYRLFLIQGETQFQIEVAWENNTNLVGFSIPDISYLNNQVVLSGREFSGYCDVMERHASLVIGVTTPVAAVDYFFRVVFALMVFQTEGMMVHGAGIRHNGSGYLFFGHSGSGKTTVSRSSVNDEVLNDDLVALMPQGNTWRMYSTPFWNPTQVKPKSLAAPLTAMYRLIQDNKVYLESFKTGQALAEFMANIPIISSNPTQSECLMERCITLLRQVPAYRLHFLPDDSFWQVIAG
jgi:hypothetical protein